MTTKTLHRCKSGKTSYLEGGTGVPVIFLHGFPGSAYSWESAALTLLEKQSRRHRVIIPDLLGFGESDPANDDWHMEGQARAVASLLRSLHIKDFFLAAHDFGGPVALTLLRLYPEFNFHRLVLASTNLFTDTPIPLPLRSARIPILGDLVFGAMAGSPFGLRMMYQFAACNKKSLTWQDFNRHMTPHGMDSTRQTFQRSLADLPGHYRPIEAFASQIKIPTFLLWGDRDPFFPVHIAKRCQAYIPNSALKIYKQTGHFVPEERPSQVADDLATFFE